MGTTASSLISMSNGGLVRNLVAGSTNDTHIQRLWGTLGADIDRNQKFFAARVADGGEAFYRVIFSGIDPQNAGIEVWAAGYEAPSRGSILIDKAPHAFDQCQPYQFPKGFGRAIKIEIL